MPKCRAFLSTGKYDKFTQSKKKVKKRNKKVAGLKNICTFALLLTVKNQVMTFEALDKGLELKKKIEFHTKEAEVFEGKAEYIERKMHPTDYLSKPVFTERLQTTETNNNLRSMDFRSKSLVTFLRIEAQYHDQEAKKYERELKRL